RRSRYSWRGWSRIGPATSRRGPSWPTSTSSAASSRATASRSSPSTARRCASTPATITCVTCWRNWRSPPTLRREGNDDAQPVRGAAAGPVGDGGGGRAPGGTIAAALGRRGDAVGDPAGDAGADGPAGGAAAARAVDAPAAVLRLAGAGPLRGRI